MTSQQQAHSELASNIKKKIHHSPATLLAEPNQSSQFQWQQSAAFRPGREEKKITAPGGPGTFPIRQLNDISVLKTLLLFHIYTQDTTHLFPEDTLHFQKCASTIYFLFSLAYGPTPKSITNMSHKSGVKHSNCLQATSPDLI